MQDYLQRYLVQECCEVWVPGSTAYTYPLVRLQVISITSPPSTNPTSCDCVERFINLQIPTSHYQNTSFLFSPSSYFSAVNSPLVGLQYREVCVPNGLETLVKLFSYPSYGAPIH